MLAASTAETPSSFLVSVTFVAIKSKALPTTKAAAPNFARATPPSPTKPSMSS